MIDHDRLRKSLVDKVDAEEMQYHAPENKIRKRPVPTISKIIHHKSTSVVRHRFYIPLMTPSVEIDFVLRRSLHPQTDGQDELTYRSREAGEKGIEWLERESVHLP